MSCYRRWIVAAGTAIAVMSPTWAAAERPARGICECGTYSEAPTLCAPLGGTKRNACISTNLRWLDKCVAWRNAICRAADTSAGAAKMSVPPLFAAPAQSPAAQQVAPTIAPPSPANPSSAFAAALRQPVPVIIVPEVEKFGGSWAGQAKCRAASDKWRLTMLVAQTADGKLIATATTSQALDTFSRSEFKDNDVILHFGTLLSNKVYAGHLVAPNRIEGKVHVAGSDCTWYLTR